MFLRPMAARNEPRTSWSRGDRASHRATITKLHLSCNVEVFSLPFYLSFANWSQVEPRANRISLQQKSKSWRFRRPINSSVCRRCVSSTLSPFGFRTRVVKFGRLDDEPLSSSLGILRQPFTYPPPTPEQLTRVDVWTCLQRRRAN